MMWEDPAPPEVIAAQQGIVQAGRSFTLDLSDLVSFRRVKSVGILLQRAAKRIFEFIRVPSPSWKSLA